MSATVEILERIKKLLRLARSSNPHEAQLALARALALAKEHSVAIEGLNPDEATKEKTVTHRDTDIESRQSYDKRYAWAICRAFFNVSTVLVHCVRVVDGWPRAAVKTAVVGTPSDIEIACYVFGFLTRHFSFCWRTHRGRLRNRRAFVNGMYCGIASKLAEQMHDDNSPEAKGTELAIDVRKNYIGTFIGKTTQRPMGEPDHAADAAASAGWMHGRNTQINSALKPAPAGPLALTC